MRRREFLGAFGGTASWPLASGAQVAARPRIGFISGSSENGAAPLLAALRGGLAVRGYVEPATVELVLRFANGSLDRIPELVRNLVEADIKVLVTSGIVGARAAHDVTRTLPIVIAGAIDILGSGLVASLARPGGNITGLTQQRIDTASKEVELLAQLVPGLARLSVLRSATGSASGAVGPQAFEAIRAAAATLGIEAQSYQVTSADDVDAALAAMVAAGSQAVVVVDAPLLSIYRERVVAARLPVFASAREYVEAGALASFGASLSAIYYRAAYFVDRILKGAKPEDLPVEQPTTFELVINLRTAKALGLTIPPPILARADEVIE
jgi:putative ABC transport system substrate-binding protein